MSEVTGFSLLFAAVGLLFVGLGVPLMRGRVPPNHFYGCRTSRTLSDPDVWYEANRASGRDFLVAGLVVLFASLASLLFGQDSDPTRVVAFLLSVLLLAVAAAAWRCFKAGRRA